MLTRLSAITPNPTQRSIPASPLYLQRSSPCRRLTTLMRPSHPVRLNDRRPRQLQIRSTLQFSTRNATLNKREGRLILLTSHQLSAAPLLPARTSHPAPSPDKTVIAHNHISEQSRAGMPDEGLGIVAVGLEHLEAAVAGHVGDAPITRAQPVNY